MVEKSPLKEIGDVFTEPWLIAEICKKKGRYSAKEISIQESVTMFFSIIFLMFVPFQLILSIIGMVKYVKFEINADVSWVIKYGILCMTLATWVYIFCLAQITVINVFYWRYRCKRVRVYDVIVRILIGVALFFLVFAWVWIVLYVVQFFSKSGYYDDHGPFMLVSVFHLCPLAVLLVLAFWTTPYVLAGITTLGIFFVCAIIWRITCGRKRFRNARRNTRGNIRRNARINIRRNARRNNVPVSTVTENIEVEVPNTDPVNTTKVPVGTVEMREEMDKDKKIQELTAQVKILEKQLDGLPEMVMIKNTS